MTSGRGPADSGGQADLSPVDGGAPAAPSAAPVPSISRQGGVQTGQQRQSVCGAQDVAVSALAVVDASSPGVFSSASVVGPLAIDQVGQDVDISVLASAESDTGPHRDHVGLSSGCGSALSDWGANPSTRDPASVGQPTRRGIRAAPALYASPMVDLSSPRVRISCWDLDLLQEDSPPTPAANYGFSGLSPCVDDYCDASSTPASLLDPVDCGPTLHDLDVPACMQDGTRPWSLQMNGQDWIVVSLSDRHSSHGEPIAPSHPSP